MLAPTTIFHSVISFMTNTDLQHYSGDQHFSNFSQIFFCLANFFLSASIGFCALTAIIRAFRSDPHVGNFFVDMWRVVMYMFLPARLRAQSGVSAAGQPDDVRLRQDRSRRSSRAAMGTTDKGEAEAADDRRRAAGGLRSDEAIGHQRRRVLTA